MTENGAGPPRIDDSSDTVQPILDLVERALHLSDLAGFAFVAIDLSSACDKLLAISRDCPSTNC